MRHAGVLALLRKGPARWPALLLAALILLAGSQAVAVDLRALSDRVETDASLDPADPDTLTIGRQDGDLRPRTAPLAFKPPAQPDEPAALPAALVLPAPAAWRRTPAAEPPADRPSRRRTAFPRAPPARSDRN